MTKDELIAKLKGLVDKDGDTEDPTIAHQCADDLLLMYINDTHVEEAYNAIHKWYE